MQNNLTCGRLAQIVVKGRLGLDRAADYLEELRAHSRSRAVSVALLSPSPDTDPDDLDHLERVRADMLLEAAAVTWHDCPNQQSCYLPSSFRCGHNKSLNQLTTHKSKWPSVSLHVNAPSSQHFTGDVFAMNIVLATGGAVREGLLTAAAGGGDHAGDGAGGLRAAAQRAGGPGARDSTPRGARDDAAAGPRPRPHAHGHHTPQGAPQTAEHPPPWRCCSI